MDLDYGDEDDSLSADDLSESLDEMKTSSETYYSMLRLKWGQPDVKKRPRGGDDEEGRPSKQLCRAQRRVFPSVSFTAVSLSSLPMELLETIVSQLSLAEQSKIRLTCQRIRHACENELNKAFQRIQTRVQQHFQRIKSQMPRRESARRKHPLARECDIIETLHMRLTLLQMTFGKHIERKHCCFFAGEILDEVQRILLYVKQTSALGRAYKVTDELFDLSTMAMEYFKEKVEPILPEISYFSTDFSEFTPAISSPSPRTLVLSLERTAGSAGKSAISSSRRSLPSTPRITSVRHNPIVVSLKRGVHRAQASASATRKELRAMRRHALYQRKQLQEATSKLEQHERRLDEAERHIDCLMKELVARGWAQSGNISPAAIGNYAHRKQPPVALMKPSQNVIKHLCGCKTNSRAINEAKFSPALTAVENYTSDSEDSDFCSDLKQLPSKGGPDAPHCFNKSTKHQQAESSKPAETFHVDSSEVANIPTSVPC